MLYVFELFFLVFVFFFFKQKTAYEMRISDWSSDVFSSDLTVGGYRRMIRHKEAMPGEKSKLNRQSQSCRLRFAGHERDVRKTQAPGADQIPTRNAKAHNAAPLSERNVVPRMGDRQQQ